MRFSFARTGVFLLGTWMGSTALAQGVDHQIVYVAELPGVTGTGALCDPWKSPSKTGGIKEALDLCNSGANLGKGCTIVLPRGYVRIEATIDTYNGTSLRGGLVIQGHGTGEKYFVPASGDSFSGTMLRWWSIDPVGCSNSTPIAPANGTVLRVAATTMSKFQDFSIDGGGNVRNTGTAGIGIDITNPSPLANQITVLNVFDNVYITDINGSPGIGVKIAPPDGTTFQTSEISLSHMTIHDTNTGVLQKGQQTTNIRWRDTSIAYYRDYGMDFVDGAIQTKSVTFNNSDTSIADIVVRHNATDHVAGWALFDSNYHETTHGSAYLFEQGTTRPWPTTFLNTRVLWFQQGGRIIDYQQTGALSIIGCSFEAYQQTDNGVVYVDNPGGASPSTVSTFGNLWVFNASGGVKLQFGPGSVSGLISNDDPLKAFGQLNSAVTDHLVSAGLIYEGGSQNWRDTGAASNSFTQYPNSGQLRLRNATEEIAYWNQSGNLHFQKSTGGVEFEGGAGSGVTTVQAADPGSTSKTVTIPPVTGTVMVSNSTAAQMICGNLSVDPPSISGGNTLLHSITVTGAALGDVCTCVPAGDWDNKVVQKYCIATAANTVNIALYNAGTGNVNPGAKTVDYCCTRK